RLIGLNRDPNIVLSPRSSRDILRQLVLAARKSIDVYAEEVADSGMEHTLIQAARSVHVRMLVASTYSSPGIAVLLGGGVAVRHLRFPYVHAKVIVADGKEAFVGSENLSTTSLDQNREVGILLRGRVMSQLVRTFEQDWSNAR
ncbi:MAG TPA: phospholipase D-like domain-containing protein, partial [Chloroflexota bacterium]